MNEPNAPPAPDEFEVSLFGPGVGESVVVHMGSNEWLVADSCCAVGSKRPAALEYLERLGVHVASAVKLVVVTHWHDDHIKGISQVLEAATGAKLFCSAALNGKEFLNVISHYRKSALIGASSGVDEMHSVLRILKERTAGRADRRSTGPEWVKANECIWRRGSSSAVHALSPASGALTLALQEFGESLDTIAPRKRAVAQTKNEVAVALWIEVDGFRALLGSDLEESDDPNCGWQAVVASTARPPGKAQIFKVPHHGSETAHSNDVWAHMVASDPHAVLSTFTSGRKPLPTLEDIERLGARASSLHSTTTPRGWGPPKRDSAVERTVKNVVTSRRVLRGPMGHVRLRCKLGQSTPDVAIELFGSAMRLSA